MENPAHFFSQGDTTGNVVFLDKNGLINNQYVGAQTYSSVKMVADNTVQIAHRLKERKLSVNILVNLERITNTNAASRRAASEALRLLIYDKIALFGGSKFLKYVARLIIMASGKSAKIRYFDTKQGAEKWLLLR